MLLSERLPRVTTGVLERVPAVAIGLGFLAALWPFARLDFDRNHDGYMLTVAIAHHSGLDLHREIASHYGPLSTWTQEPFLHLPIAPAFALRIWTVLLLAGTAATIADLGRVAPARWRLNLWTSSSAAVVWALMCDRWLGLTLHPWSSVLAAFLTAMAMHCWVHAESRSEGGQATHARWLFIASGVAIGLSPFARVNVGLAAVIGTITVAVLTQRLRTTRSTDRPERVPVLHYYALGLFAGVLLPIARLGWTRSLGAYVEQGILTPLAWSGNSDWQPRAYVEDALRRTLPLVLVLVLGVFAITLISNRLRAPAKPTSSAERSVGILVVAVIAAGSGVVTLHRFANSVTPDRGNQSLLGVLENWEWASYTGLFLEVGLVTTAVSALGLGASYVTHLVRRRDVDSEVVAMMVAGALGLAGLTQIYPTHDSRHVWWGLPLGLLATAWTVRRVGRSRAAGSPFLAFAALLATTAASGWVAGRSVERFDHSSTISSAGFRSSRNTAVPQIEDEKLLARTVGSTAPVLFYVYDHDLPSLLGQRILPDEYAMADRAFIRPTLASRLESRPALVVDNWDPDMQSLAPIGDFMRGTDYFLSARSPTRVILLAPPCINGSCEGIDPDEVCMAWGSCRPRSFRADAVSAVELPVGDYLDADAVIPEAVFAQGFSTDQRSGRWAVDRLAGDPVLIELPLQAGLRKPWITGQRAVLRFSSGDSATPSRVELKFRTSPIRQVEVHVLTTAQQTTAAVGSIVTTVQLTLDANSVQEVVIRCESLEASITAAPELPVCAELIGMTLHE